MRRIILAAVAVLGLTNLASANWGTPPIPQQGAPAPAPTNMYGWNQKLLWWKKAPAGCPGGNCGGGAGAGQQMPGTLVFPQHQFIRSPRDYFMQDAK